MPASERFGVGTISHYPPPRTRVYGLLSASNPSDVMVQGLAHTGARRNDVVHVCVGPRMKGPEVARPVHIPPGVPCIPRQIRTGNGGSCATRRPSGPEVVGAIASGPEF